jgi:hypothetical protein
MTKLRYQVAEINPVSLGGLRRSRPVQRSFRLQRKAFDPQPMLEAGSSSNNGPRKFGRTACYRIFDQYVGCHGTPPANTHHLVIRIKNGFSLPLGLLCWNETGRGRRAPEGAGELILAR